MKDKIREIPLKIYEDVILANEIFIDTELLEKYKKSIKGIKIKDGQTTNEQLFLKLKELILKLSLVNQSNIMLKERRNLQNRGI